MTIIKRQKKANPFVQMDRTIFNNKELSYKAKGLYAHLMALPDDWTIYEKDLANRSTDTLYSVKSAIKELIEAGFISRRKVNGEGGKLEWETVFYEYESDNPYHSPRCDIPTSDLPTSAIRTYTNELDVLINKRTVDDDVKNFDNLIQKLQSEGLHFMNNSTNISKFATTFKTLGPELSEHLTSLIITKKPKHFSYIDSIVNNWKANGIDTVEKAIAESETRQKKQVPKKDEDFDKLREMFGG